MAPKRIQSIIVGRKEEGKPMDLPAEEHPLMSAAQDLSDALKSNDIEKVAQALEAAFQIADSMPHEEGPHDAS